MASALRRKRDEIAAMIVAHEARIDAARKDLAALDQAARLFDLEAGRDETVISSDVDRLTKSEEILGPPREVSKRQRALAADQLNPPVARTRDPERQLTEEVAHTSNPVGLERIPEEFF
jgi:transposase